MQTNLLLNVLMSGTAATGASPQASLLGTLLGTPAAGTVGNQFTSLLGQPGKQSDLALLSTNNPTGDTGTSPQVDGIANLGLATYIDAPKQLVLPKPDFSKGISLDSAKKNILPSNNIAVANDIVNDQEFQNAVKNLDNNKPGKIELPAELAELPTDSDQIMSKVATALNTEKPATPESKKAHTDNAQTEPTHGQQVAAVANQNNKDASTNDLLNKFKNGDAIEGVKGKHGLKSDDFKVNLETADSTSTAHIGKMHELQNGLKEIKLDAKAQTLAGATPADQIQVKISQMVKDGLDMIRIKLHPEDLGQVDIQMDVSNDGSTAIRIVADKQETLDMLRKDSHVLEKALRDTGVKTDAGGMQFSLREGNQQQQQFAGFTGKYKASKELSAINDNYLKTSALERTYNMSLRPDGVNILA